MFFKKKILLFLTLLFATMSLNAKDPGYNKGYAKYYIESIAKSKLGKKYVWGGNGPYAYDCSGFTKEVFELNGIAIPRNSWKQAEVGQKVSKKNLKKGDLIFFNSKDHKGVNHVGIYLGKGKFIHASKFHKRIVISPLREYRRFFKWGRRLT
jgi:cell wall-associated NlpC family hydrolase